MEEVDDDVNSQRGEYIPFHSHTQTHMNLTHRLPLKGFIHAVMLYPVLIHVSNVMPTHRRVCFFAVRPDANPNHGGWGGTDREIL